MQLIFEINMNEADEQFFNRFRHFFAGRKVKITVEEAPALQPEQPGTTDPRKLMADLDPTAGIPLEVGINALSNGQPYYNGHNGRNGRPYA